MANRKFAFMCKGLVMVVVGGVVAAGAGVARAERPRIAVSGVSGDNATPELRERMSRAITDGLVASGADVVTAPGGIVYRVRGTVEVEGRTYILRLEMIDGETGAVIEGREDRCEICTESEALETAGVAASALKAQVFKRRPAVAVGTAAAPPPAGRQDLALGISVPAPESTPPPEARARHRGLGVGAMAAGVVAAGVGWYLLSLNHQGTCNAADKVHDCPDRWSTTPGGIALLTGGGLALTAGILAVAGVF
jgi:hypothetical protein